MGFKNDGVLVQEYVYDFAVDGGATSEIFLSSKAGYAPLPIGAVVLRVVGVVETACTSGGSATVAWGNDDDPDGYSGTAIAVASLTADAVFNGYDNASALLWDDTNDHPIYFRVVNEDDGEFSVTIATAALTAGKMSFLVEYMFPSAS